MEIPGSELELLMQGAGTQAPLKPGAVFLNQVHGTDVLFCPEPGETGDGMVFPSGRGFPGLKVADCLPVFAIWDGFTGAVHAGWRGLAGGIVENLLNSVDRPLRYLLLGPCICPRCYKVGESVREEVARTDPGGIQAHPSGAVDLRGSALRRAEALAGKSFTLVDFPECTLESRDLFSHRENRTSERNLFRLAEKHDDLHIQHPYPESRQSCSRGEKS